MFSYYFFFWPWIILSILFCVIGSFLYLRYTPYIYKSTSQLQIKKSDASSSFLTTEITNPPSDNSPKIGFDQYVTSTIDYDSDLTNVYVMWSIDEPIFDNIIPMSNTNDNTWISNSMH